LTLTGPTSFCPGCIGTMALNYSVSDADSGVTVWSITVDGIILADGTSAETGTIDWDGSGLFAGPHTITLTARDLAGNLTQTELVVTLVMADPIEPTHTRIQIFHQITATFTHTPGTSGSSQGQSSGSTPMAANPSATRTNIVVAFNNPSNQQDQSDSVVSASNPNSITGSSNPGTAVWGAAAAAVIGATTAYVLDERRKRKEEEAREAEKAARLNNELENLDKQRLADQINRNNFNNMMEAAEEVGVSKEKLDEYRELYRQGKFDELNKTVKADMKAMFNFAGENRAGLICIITDSNYIIPCHPKILLNRFRIMIADIYA